MPVNRLFPVTFRTLSFSFSVWTDRKDRENTAAEQSTVLYKTLHLSAQAGLALDRLEETEASWSNTYNNSNSKTTSY